MNILVAPFVNALFGLYYLTGNLGWAVVIMTVVIRILLMPLLLPSLKSAKKMRELQPKLKRLQEKYKGEKEKLAKAQMDMYKEEGINPLSGCLPQILQIAVLIIFFSAFNMVTQYSEGKGDINKINSQLISQFQIKEDFKFNVNFMGSDLAATPAKAIANGWNWGLILPAVLLLGSGVLQFFSSKLMMPASADATTGKPASANAMAGKKESTVAVKVDQSAYVKATPEKGDDMMEAMRKQSTYMMPLMTIFLGWNFSLGILLYWFVNSAVMLGQQIISDKLQK